MRPSPAEIMLASREAVLKEFRIESCIATTRVIVNVCAYYGIAAHPMPVSVAAFSRAAWKLLGDGVPVSDWPREAGSVGVGCRRLLGKPLSTQWDGHLVAIAGNYLLDGSLDQVSRPQRGLSLGPLAIGMPRDWDRVVCRADGVVIIYQPLDDLTWRRSNNWSGRKTEFRRITGTAIRSLNCGIVHPVTREPTKIMLAGHDAG
jgi:hypothetical protein